MAKTKRRSRNIARKPKSRQSGFVTQNTNASSNGFVSQNANASSNGFVPQNSAADAPSSDRAATNRANAQHSTGPRTAEGKARSSQNARKHGLSLQRHAVLEHEDPAAYARLRDELREVYQPASPREHLALEDIAQCRWAIQRCDEAEATYLTRLVNHANDPSDGSGFTDILTPGQALGYAACVFIETDRRDRRYLEPNTDYAALDKLHRYRTHWDRRHQRALAEFDRARKDHRQQLRDAERQEQAARQAEAQAAAERRREELHQLRLAQAQAKLAREQAKTTGNEPSHAAPPSKPGEDALFDALDRYISTMPDSHNDLAANATPDAYPGFIPQNGAA